jgi:hypothetical protein
MAYVGAKEFCAVNLQTPIDETCIRDSLAVLSSHIPLRFGFSNAVGLFTVANSI